MKDQRRSNRRRTYLAGRIVFNGRASTMDCLVRNLSRNGAMLEFYGSVIPHHEVDLCILRRGESRRRALSGATACMQAFPLSNQIPLLSSQLKQLV